MHMGTVVLANALVGIVLSGEQMPTPEEVVRFAREQQAVFKRRKRGDSEYMMLQLPGDAQPELWGVDTFKRSIGRKMLQR